MRPGPPTISDNHRGTAANIAFWGMQGVQYAGGGIAIGRLIAARNLPYAQAHRGLWWLELVNQKPVHPMVPYETGWWKHSYRAGNTIGLSLGAVSLVSGVLNLKDGYENHGGVNGITGSRSGRTGVLQTVGGAASVGMLTAAMIDGARHGGGVSGALHAATASRLLGTWTLAAIGFSLSQLWTANELGAFDSLNTDNTRSVAQTFGDAVKAVPTHLPMIFFG